MEIEKIFLFKFFSIFMKRSMILNDKHFAFYIQNFKFDNFQFSGSGDGRGIFE